MNLKWDGNDIDKVVISSMNQNSYGFLWNYGKSHNGKITWIVTGSWDLLI